MTTPDPNVAAWRKSSYSGVNNGDCVEVANGIPGATPVRDSKNPGPVLTFPTHGWTGFVSALRDGTFDTH